MKVRRLCWLGVRTEAFDETTTFFRDVLGLPLGYEESGFSMFALPDADRDFVEVFSTARQDLATSYTAAPVVGLLVDDIGEARDELAAAGVELIDEIQSVASVTDTASSTSVASDGNVYALVEGSSALRR